MVFDCCMNDDTERLNNMSKKLNIRVSLLITMIVLLGSISCFVFFGPSLLAYLILFIQCYILGI